MLGASVDEVADGAYGVGTVLHGKVVMAAFRAGQCPGSEVGSAVGPRCGEEAPENDYWSLAGRGEGCVGEGTCGATMIGAAGGLGFGVVDCVTVVREGAPGVEEGRRAT